MIYVHDNGAYVQGKTKGMVEIVDKIQYGSSDQIEDSSI